MYLKTPGLRIQAWPNYLSWKWTIQMPFRGRLFHGRLAGFKEKSATWPSGGLGFQFHVWQQPLCPLPSHFLTSVAFLFFSLRKMTTGLMFQTGSHWLVSCSHGFEAQKTFFFFSLTSSNKPNTLKMVIPIRQLIFANHPRSPYMGHVLVITLSLPPNLLKWLYKENRACPNPDRLA